jgi:hypothetical protein
VNRLFEKGRPVRPLDRVLCFILQCVFDECVALYKISIQWASWDIQEGLAVGGRATDHDVSTPPVERHRQVLDDSILCKEILQIIFRRLLVQSRDDDDPPLDSCIGDVVRDTVRQVVSTRNESGTKVVKRGRIGQLDQHGTSC